MRRFLVLIGVSFLSIGISHAQEQSLGVETFLLAAKQARLCTYKVEKIELDDNGTEKGEWGEDTKNRGDILAKILSGNKNYLRAVGSLKGSIWVDPADSARMLIDAELPSELGFPLVKLRQLTVNLEQRRHGETWLPSRFEATVKYWVGFIFGFTTFEKYRAAIDCSEVHARRTN